MRSAVVVLIACALVRGAAASEANGSEETLAGWSADGRYYAVTGFRTNGAQGGEFFLEVREGDTPVYHWKQPDEADSQSPDRIDVETWPAVKQFKLLRVDDAARKRFTAQLVAASTTKQVDRYHCKPGGWSVKKKGERKALHAGTADKEHCFTVLGGYVNKAGTHALVKIREAWQLPSRGGEKVTETNARFVPISLR
jgi:hypothetical protein